MSACQMHETNSRTEFPYTCTYLMTEDLVLPVSSSRTDLAADPHNFTSRQIVYFNRGLVLLLHDRQYGR